MKGEILRNLLDSRQRLFIPGLGLFTAETRTSEIQYGSSTILPPSVRIDFSQRPQEVTFELREHLVSQYGLIASKADEMIDTFVAEIRSALSNRQRFTIPAFGTLASDLEGNIQFIPAEDQIFCLSSFGLQPVKAQQLVVQNRISTPEHEAPVIPLRPFEEKAPKRSRASLMAYAAIGAGLAMAAGSLIWLSTLGTEAGQQASVMPFGQTANSEPKTEIASVSGTTAGITSTTKVVSSITPEAPSRFFVVAGSFRNPDIANEAEKSWKKAGFETTIHPLAEKEMSRIAIGSFSTKEEAISFMGKSQSEFSSQLWILKEAIAAD
jgi:cell division septation protein DedD